MCGLIVFDRNSENGWNKQPVQIFGKDRMRCLARTVEAHEGKQSVAAEHCIIDAAASLL